MADNKSCEGNKFNVGDLRTRLQFDTSDIVKQLKAIQREAKKATAALRELEEQQKKRDMSSPTDNEAETCPVCNGRIGTQELRADGELIKIVENVCTLCGWYNA